MIPRINVGKGVTGAVHYVLGEGKGRGNDDLAPGEQSRVDWIGGTGFGFEIDSAADADLARRIMEFDALNQSSPTKQCVKDCVHLSLAWPRGETPSRADMEQAAREALDALGMKNAKALFVAHNDEDYSHVHIVASKINPDTDRAYDLAASYRKLSRWAEDYEREHGGIELKGRADMNELRDAIASRDAGAVLDAMTKQRSTFTAAQIERAVQKEIPIARGSSSETQSAIEIERAGFVHTILTRPEIVRLADQHQGPTTRYTTHAVLEGELHVLDAGRDLAGARGHGLDDAQRAAVLHSARHSGISQEQADAFRHATGPEGLAIIDGLAGTGKSRVTVPVREAYEAAGYRVIGLAWTNRVVQGMARDGFEQTNTIKRELFMLANGRQAWNSRTVILIDEAAMLDTAHMAMVTAFARDAGAKLILAGDDRQLPSIERGGMFGVLKDRHGAATLHEVQRQAAGDERRASEYFAEGQFQKALGIYDGKDAIHWTRTQREARAELLRSYAGDVTAAPDKSRFIFAYTNLDVAELNQGARQVHRSLGHLGADHQLESADGRQAFATGDRIQFTTTDKQRGINNGAIGTFKAIDGTHIAVAIDGGKTINFDTAAFQDFRHGYAGTIYKGQGDTVDQSYLYHSEHWRSAASYVGMTRHREKAGLFVARNTAPNLDQLARQMARVDIGQRYAASNFYQQEPIGLVASKTAPEIVDRFGRDMNRGEHRATRSAQAREMREAGRDTSGRRPATSAPGAARSATGGGIAGAFDVAEKVVSKIFDALSDAIAPPPPLTRDQAKRQRQAEREAAKHAAAQHPENEKRARQAEILDGDRRPDPDAEIRYDRHTGQPIGDAGRAQEHRRGRGRSRPR
jgi:hypothetical protein